mgnify:CR=1 FL=1
MDNPLYNKALDFAERILDMSEFLLDKRKKASYYPQPEIQTIPSYALKTCVEQATRSGTSIAANIAESLGVQSKADLTAKLSISYKEGRETAMWLELMRRKKYIDEKAFDSMNENLSEILKLLTASLNTLKNARKT